jgi:hypothetical protein
LSRDSHPDCRAAFTLNTTVAGNITPSIGSANGVVVGSGLGSDTEVQVITATGAGALTFTPDATWTGTITNVSVMQLTPSSATQIVRSSDGTDGLEIRSGGVGQTTNTFMGVGAGKSNVSGNRNSAFGQSTLLSNTTGIRNTAGGSTALQNNTTGVQNTALGVSVLQNNTIGSDNTSIGYRSMLANTSGNTNTAIGESALQLLTTGSNNVALGYRSGLNLTTGSKNIMIGYNINATSSSATNSLNIGNLIFGTGLDGSGNIISSGNVGIGTTTPYARLTVWGSDSASSTLSFNVVNNASTTVFAVFNGGNAQLSGTLTQSSDKRLKTNISSLDASSSLAAINSLTPVTYNWLDPEKGGVRQYGFIAQQVQQLFPELVSTTSATALTPDGTLGLNYLGLIAPLVEAVQGLSTRLSSLEATVVGFANSFTSKKVITEELCFADQTGQTCVTKSQIDRFLSGTPSVQISAPTPPVISGTTTPPSIGIAGNSPAHINIGGTYSDLGAIVTDNQGHDLSYRTFINSVLSGNIFIDTSHVATDTIDYVATDTWGNTATATRTVIIEAANDNETPNTQASTTTSAVSQ